MTPRDEEFKDRLIRAIGEESVTSFGNRCGIGESTLRSYLRGASPRLNKFLAIADAANVEIKWLATGKGPMRLGEERPASNQVNHLEDPLIKDIKLWIRDMTAEYPEWRAWFETELSMKIPSFNEWRKKKQQSAPDENQAAS